MKSLKTIGLSLALLSTMVPTTFAATPAPAVEPSNGFVRGANPEWSAIHTSAVPSEEHRTYHRNAEADRVQWLQSNSLGDMGANAYYREMRMFRAAQNLAHRLFHYPVVQEPQRTVYDNTLRPQPATGGAPVAEPVVQEMPELDLDASITDRTLSGERPSRRLIIEQAETNNDYRNR